MLVSKQSYDTSKIILVTFSVFLLVLSGFSALSRVTYATTSTETGNPQITPQWLSQQSAQWKPSANVSLNFEVLFNRASYQYLETGYNNLAVQNADLNMIVSTGANCVRIDVNYAPWLQNNQTAINELTSLIQDVKSDGECLVIADAASETYTDGGAIPWTQFQAAWIQRDKTLAELFHPNYFLVIKEPGWYVPMVSDATTNPSFQNATSWLNLTQTLAATVLSVSPNTKVGVSIAADSLTTAPSLYVPYLTGLSKLSNVSFIGFDIYDAIGFTNTQNFLTQYGNQGKQIWIAEAWTTSNFPPDTTAQEQLDAQWVLVLYYFAEYIHASAIMPFFSDAFASYALTDSSPTTPSQIISLYSQRTPVYYEYRDIISGSSGIPSTTSTTSSDSTTATSQNSSHTTSSSGSTVSSSGQSSTVTSGGKRDLRIYYAAAVVLVVLVLLGLAVTYLARRKRNTPG